MTDCEDIIKRKPTCKDWDKVRSLYIMGESLEGICRSLPNVAITQKSIMKKMAVEGLTAKKRALNERIVDNMLNLAEDEKKRVNNECIKLFNTGAKVISDLLDIYQEEISRGIGGKPKATAYNIDLLMSGVTKVQKGLRVAYGMDETGKLHEKEPELLIIEGINTEKI